MTLPETNNAERVAEIRRLAEAELDIDFDDVLWLLAQNTELRDALAAQTDFLDLCGKHSPQFDKERPVQVAAARAVLDKWKD